MEMPRSGFGGAVTCTPSAISRSTTPFQPEASAKAPCTRTTVGRDPSCGFSLITSSLSGEPHPRLRGGVRYIEGWRPATVPSFWSAASRVHRVAPPFFLGISSVEECREGLRLVHHVGGEHLRGDGPCVARVVDDARRDHKRVAGTKRERRPIIELHRHVTAYDVPNFRAGMAVPAGGDAFGDLGEGLDYLPPAHRRGKALQLRPLERGGDGWLGGLWLGGHLGFSFSQERAQLGAGLLRGLLRDVVAAVERPTAYLLGPPAPDVQDVVVPLQEPPAAPEGEQGTRHAPSRLSVLGVVLVVEGGRGPVVLTGGVDGLGVSQAPRVLLHRLWAEDLTTTPEEGVLGVGGEQALGQVVGLGQEEPMPVAEAEGHVGP